MVRCAQTSASQMVGLLPMRYGLVMEENAEMELDALIRAM